MKIFLVDDDPFSLDAYRQQLVNYGFVNVSTMLSADECLRRMNEHPEVIFIDHQMEDMNGLELLQKLKHYYPEVRITMVSGRKCVRTAVNAIKSGAHDYILKGEDDVQRMRYIVKQAYLDKRAPEKSSFIEPYKNMRFFVPFIVALFIIQSSALIHYFFNSETYTAAYSISVSFLSALILLIRQKKLTQKKVRV